jgi:hypothetical protein
VAGLNQLSQDIQLRSKLGPVRFLCCVFRESSSTGEHTPRPGTLRGCRLASHSERAIDETDSTKQKSVPPPIAIAPIRCMFSAALCKERDDAAGTQTSPDCLSVITAVA